MAAALLAVGVAALIGAGTYVPQDRTLGLLARIDEIVAIGLAAAAVWLAVLRPWQGLLLWVVAMPIINVARAQVFPGPLQMIASTVVVAALAVGWLRLRGDRPASGPTPAIELWTWLGAGALIALTILSTLASRVIGSATTPIATATPIAIHGLVEPVVLGALVVGFRPTIRQLWLLALGLGASITIGAAINLARLPSILRAGTSAADARVLFARLTYFNVGIFGILLVIALGLLLAAWLGRRPMHIGSGGRAAIGGALVVIVMSTVLTFSKSAWLGAVIVGIGVFVGGAQTWRARVLGVVAPVLLAVAVVAGPSLSATVFGSPSASPGSAGAPGPTRIDSFDPNTVEGEVSITERLLASEAALRMAADHPLVGVGPGQFGLEYAAVYRPGTATRTLGAAHDFLANVAAELGLPAVGLVIVAFLAALLAAWRAYRSSDLEVRYLGLALGGALVGFLVVGTTFGIDFYRPYRVMNSDMLAGALLVGSALACAAALRARAGAIPQA